MRWPGRGGTRRANRPQGRHGLAPADRVQLDAFVASRRGVEAYLEPATTVTPYTVVLVAHDGEWTRRPCADPAAVHRWARPAGVPVYEVRATGYPARMRAWSSAQAARAKSHRASGRPGQSPEEEELSGSGD